MFLKRDDAVIFALSISVTESLYFVTYFAVLLQNSMSNAPMAGEPSARRGYVGRNE
jgi:hypothetical protein